MLEEPDQLLSKTESSVRRIAETEPCRMADSIDNLIYAEAQGGLARQPGLFNKLSVRTGILMGVTTATTAFLGAIVVDKSGLHDWGTLALAAFIVALGCCAAVLSPHRRWTFVEGAGALFVPYCRLPGAHVATRAEADRGALSRARHL